MMMVDSMTIRGYVGFPQTLFLLPPLRCFPLAYLVASGLGGRPIDTSPKLVLLIPRVLLHLGEQLIHVPNGLPCQA